MLGMSRFGSAVQDSADWGRDAYDDTASRLDAANVRLFRLIDQARDTDLPSRRRLLDTLDDLIAALGDRGGRTWQRMAGGGQDGLDRVSRFGQDGLERLGLVRRRTWADRLGLTALPGLNRPSATDRARRQARRLGAAFADTPVVTGLTRYNPVASGRKLVDRVDVPTPSWELPDVNVRFGRQSSGFPVRRVLMVVALGAAAWYLLGSKSRRHRLMGMVSNGSQDRADHAPTYVEPTHPTHHHHAPGTLATVDNALRYRPVTDGAFSLRGDGTPTDGRSVASETAQTRSAEPVRERTHGGHTPAGGLATASTPGSVFMPSPAPGASREELPRRVDADRVSPARAEFEPVGNRQVDIDRRDAGHPDRTRDDDAILEDVEAALLAEPVTQATAANSIHVNVSGGQVTLRGTVPNPLVKRLAEERAAAVSGVTTVVNELLLGQHV